MGIFARLFGGAGDRNARLAAWGGSVPVSDKQKAAMRHIWHAVQTRTAPQGEPLAALDEGELAHVLTICSASHRPREFGDANVLRLATYRALRDDGFSETEAAVALGMMFNFVGRDDI